MATENACAHTDNAWPQTMPPSDFCEGGSAREHQRAPERAREGKTLSASENAPKPENLWFEQLYTENLEDFRPRLLSLIDVAVTWTLYGTMTARESTTIEALSI